MPLFTRGLTIAFGFGHAMSSMMGGLNLSATKWSLLQENKVTESDIWNRIKKWLPGYSVRLENSISAGMADVLWCPLGKSIFLELKVQEGPFIYVRNSQFVFGIQAAASVPANQHLFVVGTIANRNLSCYTYNCIAAQPATLIGKSKRKVFIGHIIPDYVWTGGSDVCNYVIQLEEKARNG